MSDKGFLYKLHSQKKRPANGENWLKDINSQFMEKYKGPRST